MTQMNRRQFIQFLTAAVAVTSVTTSAGGAAYADSPDCKNPEHPAGASKKMIFLTHKDHARIFGCQACWDRNHVQSVQVITDPDYQQEVRRQLAAQGRLLTQPPVIMRAAWKRNKPTATPTGLRISQQPIEHGSAWPNEDENA
jgi:hypothetical protein